MRSLTDVKRMLLFMTVYLPALSAREGPYSTIDIYVIYNKKEKLHFPFSSKHFGQGQHDSN